MEQPSKYVLTLDSLDLSLLPSYQSRLNSNTTSLWSASNLNGKSNDYFQFEIKPKSEDSDKTSEIGSSIDGSLEEATCYICNLKVPVAYIIDHENSLKHQAYVKIAEVVLDRARQHMLKRDNRHSVKKVDSMYFCGPCVTIVRATDKENHEKSKLHKRSISLDRLLFELVSLYTENDDPTEAIATSHTNKSDEENLVSTESSTDDNGNDLNTEVDRNLENTVLISDIKSLNKPVTEKRKETAFNVNKLNNATSTANVTIETVDGCEISVSEDHFHGFTRIGKHHIQCKVCKMIVKDVEEHKSSKEHVNKILKPFKDKNCIRNLDNSWSHCVICNEVIENSDLHALCNESHENLLQKALVVHKAPPNKFNILIEDTTPPANTALDSAEYYCTVCNIGMHVNNTESHMRGNKHAMNSKSSLYYLMKQVDGSIDLVCRLCDASVVDDPIEVEKHLKINDHSRNLKEILSKNYVKLRKDEFYCKPCDVTITKKNEFYHIEKMSHQINLEAFTQNSEVSNKALESVDTKNESNSVDKLNFYFCHVCNVKTPNNPNNIRSHNEGNKHRKNVANVMSEIENAIERATSNIHYQMELTQNEKELWCKVCNVIVPNKEGNIDEHTNGSKHRNNEKKLMEDNRIEMKGDRYFCNICNVLILNEQQFLHIKLPTHLRLLNNLPQKPETTTTESETKVNATIERHNTVSLTENAETSNTEKALPKNIPVNVYAVLKHHFAEMDDPNVVNCRVCSVKLPHTVLDVLNHANDKIHMDGYKDLMSRNLIFETDGSTFFCGVCNCLVPGKGEFHHVFGSRHADNFTQVIANDKCDICDVTTDMAEHIITPQHILKLKQTQTTLHHCEICNALIMKNERDFILHSANCELMLKHRLVVKDKICFCIICDLYFARDLIEEHTQSNHHLLLFNMIT